MYGSVKLFFERDCFKNKLKILYLSKGLSQRDKTLVNKQDDPLSLLTNKIPTLYDNHLVSYEVFRTAVAQKLTIFKLYALETFDQWTKDYTVLANFTQGRK